MKHLTLNAITLVMCHSLLLTSANANKNNLSTIKNDDNAIEKIEVQGRRNQANSEVSVETEKLLAIAGLDHDPLNAVFSMPGVVYAGGDNGGEPAIRGSSPDDNAL